ncbi:MAG: DNA-3-methyladenine glycosylase 2 family protein [Christensenellaceae bacterium]|jgi:N-glycosylase/DNA lyase|nr:DNA-3-methyladenine glycosylase 2 family protein [Christensenellaceae bacterium]
MLKNCRAAGESLLFEQINNFDLAKSCACGQAFRWEALPAQAGVTLRRGVVRGRAVTVRQAGGNLTITPGRLQDTPLWADYFDLERDYAAIEALLRADARLSPTLDAAQGIHIFNQEPFETLISFIISANNNIGRITGIIGRLCALAGEPIDGGGYAFPTPRAMAALTQAQLRDIGAGYRAPFLLQSARSVAEGFALEPLGALPLEQAQKALCALPGVGPKVADCILLFSLRHTGAFPMDVWMKRAVRILLFDGSQPSRAELAQAIGALGEHRGILQQYMFQYAREHCG